MNSTIKKCIDHLKTLMEGEDASVKRNPDLMYILGMLETIVDQPIIQTPAYNGQSNVQQSFPEPTKPEKVTPPFPPGAGTILKNPHGNAGNPTVTKSSWQ